MIDYTGYKCKSCGNTFKQDDDIVVCPDCGTPYHRDCWRAQGKCINEELHAAGASWQIETEREKERQNAERDTVSCAMCGNKLRSDQLYCDKCGAPSPEFPKLNAQQAGRQFNGGYYRTQGGAETGNSYQNTGFAQQMFINPNEDFGDGVTASELSEYVGNNTIYYMPKFKFMKDSRVKLFPNLCAMLFPELYFSYRKMPLTALAVMLLKCICSIPDVILNMQSMSDYMPEYLNAFFPSAVSYYENFLTINTSTSGFQGLYIFCTAISWILTLALGFFGNYMYMRHSIRKTAQLKQLAAERNVDKSILIRENGGTSWAITIAFLAIYMVLTYAISIGVIFIVQ